ncbi:MAG: hypothetical protein OXI26_11280 [bacterium]|nr:hypothetical protein [bacterium]
MGVPCLVALCFALRKRLPNLEPDIRGIALQTVIIMVVLLAIAGAIAGVLIARGEEAVADVERQQVARTAGDYSRESLCKAAGFQWTNTATNVGTWCE